MCTCVMPFIAQIQAPEKESESDLHPPLMNSCFHTSLKVLGSGETHPIVLAPPKFFLLCLGDTLIMYLESIVRVT